MFAGEHPPGAAEAGLHLVDTEERAVATAELLGGRQIPGLGQYDALALDRFGQKERHVLVAQLRFERSEVVERHPRHARQQRAEPGALIGAAVHRERSEGEPVETVLDGDCPGPAGGGARQLEGGLDGLGAAVDEQHAIGGGGSVAQERLGE